MPKNGLLTKSLQFERGENIHQNQEKIAKKEEFQAGWTRIKTVPFLRIFKSKIYFFAFENRAPYFPKKAIFLRKNGILFPQMLVLGGFFAFSSVQARGARHGLPAR